MNYNERDNKEFNYSNSHDNHDCKCCEKVEIYRNGKRKEDRRPCRYDDKRYEDKKDFCYDDKKKDDCKKENPDTKVYNCEIKCTCKNDDKDDRKDKDYDRDDDNCDKYDDKKDYCRNEEKEYKCGCGKKHDECEDNKHEDKCDKKPEKNNKCRCCFCNMFGNWGR